LDFETIYREYYGRVYNYVYGQVLHREAAEDLTADVFVVAAANLGRFDPARGKLAPWLFTIARNLTLNYQMRFSTRLEESCGEVPEKLESAPSTRDDSLRAPESLRAEHILERLSMEERRFLELRYMLELSNEEIGRIVGTTSAAVSQRYHRLLAKCRKLDKG
jgi:RNA polymerase sigma-70 factor (ECF subfamily)